MLLNPTAFLFYFHKTFPPHFGSYYGFTTADFHIQTLKITVIIHLFITSSQKVDDRGINRQEEKSILTKEDNEVESTILGFYLIQSPGN